MALTANQITYLRDAYAPRKYLVEVDAYDLAASAVTTIYYSTEGFTTNPSDTLSNVHFEGRVKSALSMSRNMYSPGKIGGRSVPSFGTIKLINTDGKLDYLQGYSLNGRDIKVKVGDGTSYDSFFNIFVGTMDQIEWTANEVIIKIRDYQHKLDKDIEIDKYTGTVEVSATAQAGSTTSVTLASSSSTTSNYYKYMDIEIVSGTGYDQKRNIIDYNATTKVVTISSTAPWIVAPDNTSVYKIYNNNNGSDRIKDKYKPLCYGEVNHIVPIEIDPNNRVFQVHNGQIEDIIAVYSGGYQIGSCSTGTYTNARDCEAAGYTWSVPAGVAGFTKDLANGKFTLGSGSSSDYVITADVKGSKEVDPFNVSAGYENKLGNLIKRIVTTKGGLVLSDIDTASFTAFETATTPIQYGDLGYYVPDGENILNVLDSLISSLGAFYTFDREGKLVVGVLTEPSITVVESFTNLELISISRKSTGIPTVSNTIGSGKLWNVFSEGDMAGAVLSDDPYRNRLENEFIDEKYEDLTVKTKHLLAEEADKIDTYLTCNCMGYEEAKRIQLLYGVERNLFVIKVKTQPFMLELNDTIQIKIDRYGLTNGKNMRIVSLNEDALKNEVTMEVWG